jgi:hypothetical protein
VRLSLRITPQTDTGYAQRFRENAYTSPRRPHRYRIAQPPGLAQNQFSIDQPFARKPMFPESSIPELAHVIQLAVAPVFLLTALSTMLAVLTNRLARVVDRTRKLEVFILEHPERSNQPRNELSTLFRRTVLCNRAISLCTLTALLICTVIALLFISALMGFNATYAVAGLFVISMASFILALLSFLQEIRVASRALESSAQKILELTANKSS